MNCKKMDKSYTEWVPARFVLCGLLCFGAIIGACLQLNLNLTIVTMVNQTATAVTVRSSQECFPAKRFNVSEPLQTKEGEFSWNQYTQGMLLGAMFYGYICTRGIGGLLERRLGAKWLILGGVLIPSLLSLITPFSVRIGGAPLLFVLRILQGLGVGILLPVFYALLSRWTPVLERTMTISLTHVGTVLGGGVTIILTGYITAYNLIGGWPAIFYFTGILGCVFSLAWFFLAHEAPQEHPKISEEELLYITKSLEAEAPTSTKGKQTPWRSILTSSPFWSLMIIRYAFNWGVVTLQTAFPLYLQTALNVPVEQNGLVNGLVYLAAVVGSLLSSILADALRRKTKLRITTIRKIFSTIAYIGSCICLFTITSVGCNTGAAFFIVFTAKFFAGLAIAGDFVTVVDMAPQHAGTLSGIIFTVSDTAGFLSPLVTGIITEDDVRLEQWNLVFCLAAGLQLLGLVVFLVFGSAEIQPWGLQRGNEDEPFAEIVTESRPLINDKKNGYDSMSTSNEA